MKTFVLLFAAVVLAIPAFPQGDPTLETSPVPARAARAAQRKLDAERRMRESLEGKPLLVYGGFFVVLSRAEKKSKLLSLRQPRDARMDNKHLYFDERTERPKGFVLFSVGF